ncbi:hypothetical protein TEA_013557 [Camellia sinensis var. sinensis]|uniref:Malectin-like domain-containing protein n=1 Tax=Camellia sinensis var. sinensis TaxID=542762 RepID=A0A4S4EB14_CAMSN|nr:hypothetical protein TEA_013557 [Camellia sinensis var. sinensis]
MVISSHPFLHHAVSLSPPPPLSRTLIDCGATVPTVINGSKWLPDAGFISAGTPKNLSTAVLLPILSTVRSFPLRGNLRRKFCYDVPAYRTGKYLIRTTYFYGGINGNNSPPVFDQIVDGTFWSLVNTTDDFLQGLSSYYEGVFVATGKSISVCIAANTYTDSDPFISALELVLLANSLYNSTNFGTYGLRLVARHSFGYNGSIIGYPDDLFDRYWEPFGENNPTMASGRDVSVSGFWNLPPLKIFETKLTTSQPVPLEFKWPPTSLPNSSYYIALYFADDRNSSSRVFNISINGIIYYQDLNVTSAGVVVFANQWPLIGLTKITLNPAAGSSIGPLINAGEVFEELILGGKTLTRDVIALEQVKQSFQNPPTDWNGDPCLPSQYSWTGVTCSGGPRIRVVALNLTSMGLSGSLSPNLGNLTALSDIWLGNNSLSGTVPDFSPLKRLERLHLEDNQLSGEIPPSLGNINSLRELFLQGNNLTGQVPSNLIKAGLNLKTSPGNQFLSPPPS